MVEFVEVLDRKGFSKRRELQDGREDLRKRAGRLSSWRPPVFLEKGEASKSGWIVLEKKRTGEARKGRIESGASPGGSAPTTATGSFNAKRPGSKPGAF
jgi:hypothetical protein